MASCVTAAGRKCPGCWQSQLGKVKPFQNYDMPLKMFHTIERLLLSVSAPLIQKLSSDNICCFLLPWVMCEASLRYVGPAMELTPLLKKLADEGVFVRELDTKGQAFHSLMLRPTIPDLTESETAATQCPSSCSPVHR
jgi:hypothetical protein